jgi:hypothetical protein
MNTTAIRSDYEVIEKDEHQLSYSSSYTDKSRKLPSKARVTEKELANFEACKQEYGDKDYK